MSTPLNLKLDPEKVHEMPMVDLAFLILKTANTPFYYRDLMNEIAKLRGLSEDQIMDVIAHLYTEINIDGRFACVGGNMWGLKRWYPVDRSEEAITGGAKRPHIINDDDDDDDYSDEDDNYSNDEDFDFTEEESEDEDMFVDEDEAVEEEEEEEGMLEDEELEEDAEEEEESDDEFNEEEEDNL
ncbi:MAG: DNA-directed RNA polymerase subunit delta [Paenibacillus sp.]|uniref:Probable DNA-directed RNA polymerase subunit delta n=1 Tax=Paenibacillus aquistagni TaxID=1852522 RepID=A0A1X7LXQ5_9BACL|nr:DNA-directed RNA polymerase subunit delta [Paenibacillus aquistagni]MBR2567617.1 DNA-directed RNA polymerase subunit delta [Paenibacillus sp.]NMM55081.1 DNA-directed RNA polymerase subunit delta [Paenibacillus aquistagni]SMG58696.1 DNA-directed RNA polymerase subunit delta [Paenibacillus aquistagni]